MKHCPRCERDLPLDAFYMRRGTQTHSYCKKCVNNQTTDRQRNLKKQAIEYKGGKCVDCDGVFHPAVFDFHHLNPDEKDFSLSHRKQLKFGEEIKQELDKCVLLCSNCHRMRHVRY